MKKLGDMFRELGFKPEGSDEVKIAFIKNLVKTAYGVDLAGPGQAPRAAAAPKVRPFPRVEPVQLSFDFEKLKKAN